ncbi:MAG: hypothetical protein U1F68_12275 [Gammaproteobacteria bacterium]
MLPLDRAFVVQFGAPGRADVLAAGRAEHITSGRVIHFQSIEQLLAFLRDTLAGPDSVQTP